MSKRQCQKSTVVNAVQCQQQQQQSFLETATINSYIKNNSYMHYDIKHIIRSSNVAKYVQGKTVTRIINKFTTVQ